MSNHIVLLTLFGLFITGCASNDDSQPPKDTKLVKEITEILDAIEKDPDSERFLRYPGAGIASSYDLAGNIIARETEIKVLIENSSISLPMMFERFGKLPKTSSSLSAYFIVFEHTKSAEAIPCIADFLAYWNNQKEIPNNLFGMLEYALITAQSITNILELPDALNAFYKKDKEEFSGKRLEVIKKLRQWYEEYKKSHK